MNRNIMALLAILGIALLAILGYLAVVSGFFNGQDNVPPQAVNFDRTGNLARNNAGLKPDTWYLIFEVPGQAASTTELTFTTTSTCITAATSSVCNPQNLQNGQRARVQGTQLENVVTVTRLTLIEEAKDEPSNGNGTSTNNGSKNGGSGTTNPLIQVTRPTANALVSSPLIIEGRARGNWYFEGDFPVKILDANGRLLGSTPAQAQGEWMTTDFVPFRATLTFTPPTTQTGTLVLEKDNPSGLPQNADEIRIPVRFETRTRDIKLYYYNESRDRDTSGTILCSRAGLVAVDRNIPLTNTPIQDSIRELFKGNLTTAERSQGLTTEYPLPGLELRGANLASGILTLEFADPQNRTGGGACRAGVLWYQIEATAKQFVGVNEVRFIPTTLFQP